MAFVTSGLPGLPRRRGFGGSRAVRNCPARLRRAGLELNTMSYFRASLSAKAVSLLADGLREVGSDSHAIVHACMRIAA